MTVQEQTQRVKVTMDLSPKLYQTLENLAKATKEDNATVLLKAIVLMELAVEAKQQGKHLWIVGENDSLESEIVGI